MLLCTSLLPELPAATDPFPRRRKEGYFICLCHFSVYLLLSFQDNSEFTGCPQAQCQTSNSSGSLFPVSPFPSSPAPWAAAEQGTRAHLRPLQEGWESWHCPKIHLGS